jgi:hypothetical protein
MTNAKIFSNDFYSAGLARWDHRRFRAQHHSSRGVVPPRATDVRVQIVPYVPETVLCCLPKRGVGCVGYRTWDEYCETELGGVHLWLPREERPQVVDSLREAGRFTRTIASVTGQSLTNVHGVAIP